MIYKITDDLPTLPNHKHWQFCVGSCHAAMAMRSDYAKQLKFIHDELHIKYVRFHGIFNDDMHTMDTFHDVFEMFPDGDTIIERNFFLCGVVYDNVLSCGMKPFVELSFMPNALASEKNKTYATCNNSHPEDLEAWDEYITSFIEYLLHRYGKEEVESWYFEVWNEPDLKGAFYLGTQEQYFQLYETTAKAIKRIDPRLRVGGPATSGSKWIAPFLSYCQKYEVPLDFISTHQYCGDPLTGVSDEEQSTHSSENKKEKLKKALEMLKMNVTENTTILELTRTMFGDPTETKPLSNDVFVKNSKYVKELAKDCPVYYTEWNLQATFGGRSNDTRKAAAYDIKTALAIEKNVNGSSIWCFSDLFEEMHQFKEEFHGGFGLQTIHGIPKPAFYGLKMMEQTGDIRFDLGEDALNQEVGIAAYDHNGEKQVLLFRQKMKQLDLPKVEVAVQVEMRNFPERVVLQRIDEDHCNPLRIWEELGCPDNLNPQEVNDIIEKSKMRTEVVPFTYKDGYCEVKVFLGVNDVYFICFR